MVALGAWRPKFWGLWAAASFSGVPSELRVCLPLGFYCCDTITVARSDLGREGLLSVYTCGPPAGQVRAGSDAEAVEKCCLQAQG